MTTMLDTDLGKEMAVLLYMTGRRDGARDGEKATIDEVSEAVAGVFADALEDTDE